MGRRIEFRPAVSDELETRVVLNGGGFRNPSVVVAGLHPRSQALTKHAPQPIVTLVNKAFDSFVQDFSDARGTYLSSLSKGSKDTTSNTAFVNYTSNRVELLAQQVTSSALQSSLSSSRQRGQGPTLPLLVAKYISGKDRTGTYNVGTLEKALATATPGNDSSAAATALSSLAQDQAIEAARVGVINGLNIIKNGDYGNKRGH